MPSKPIVVAGGSSMVELKAELYRKQGERAAAAAAASRAAGSVVKSQINLKNAQCSLTERVRREAGTKAARRERSERVQRLQREIDEEEQEARRRLDAAKEKLNEKAKLYEQMTGQCGGPMPKEIDAAGSFMVDFDRKAQLRRADAEAAAEDNRRPRSRSPPNADNNHEEEDSGDLVEYMDEFGRTRRCPPAELHASVERAKDAEVRLRLQGDARQAAEAAAGGDDADDEEPEPWPDEPPVGPVHYQHVSADDARQLGAGYYQFSKDEEQRAAEQQALKQTRHATLEARARADKLRQKREAQMRARLEAVRKRRQLQGVLDDGLSTPADDDDETAAASSGSQPVVDDIPLPDGPTAEDRQAAASAVESAIVLGRKRAAAVRPWDKGKVEEPKSKQAARDRQQQQAACDRERAVLSQDEWNERKRTERQNEFAPPKSYFR